MINIHLPTTDGRRIVMCSYTQPDKDDSVLLAPWDCHFLNNRRPRFMHQDRSGCSADLLMCPLEFTGLAACLPLELRRSGYIQDERWHELQEYGVRQAQKLGLKEQDIERLVNEYRQSKH